LFKNFCTPVLINLTLFFLADRRGDHIFICGSNSYNAKKLLHSTTYYHHGIYIGESNGKEVADFGREQHKYPVYCTLDKFMEGPDGEPKTQLYRRNYKNGAFLEEETLKLVDQICQKKDFLHYDVLGTNCEHFASIAKTGHKTSIQVHRFFFWLTFPIIFQVDESRLYCATFLGFYNNYFKPISVFEQSIPIWILLYLNSKIGK